MSRQNCVRKPRLKVCVIPETMDDTLVLCEQALSRKDLEIVKLIAHFHKLKMFEKIPSIYPSIAYLAKNSGCSPRTVKNFLKRYDHVLFKRINRYDKKKKKQMSNLYKLNENFFGNILILKELNIFDRWDDKSYQQQIIERYMSDNETFIKEFIHKRILVNNKIAPSFWSKLPTIQEVLYPRYIHKDLRQDPLPRREGETVRIQACEQVKPLEIGLASHVPGLSYNQKKQLSEQYSPYVINKACRIYCDMKEKQPIHSSAGFIFGMCRKITAEMLHLKAA